MSNVAMCCQSYSTCSYIPHPSSSTDGHTYTLPTCLSEYLWNYDIPGPFTDGYAYTTYPIVRVSVDGI